MSEKWLEEWASSVVYENSEQFNKLVFMEVLPKFPDCVVQMGPKDGFYVITLTGNIEATVSIPITE